MRLLFLIFETEANYLILKNGIFKINNLLRTNFADLFEDYLQRLHKQTSEDPDNEGLVDRNTRLACDLHAHKLLMYRNNNHTSRKVTEKEASNLLSSFVFLTGRHVRRSFKNIFFFLITLNTQAVY